MPTNQSSPWNGGNPRHCSNVDKTTTTMTTTPKVPYNPASIELARSKEQAKAPACNAASTVPLSRLTTVAPPVFSVWEKGDKKTAECQITTVPHISSNMPQQLNGIQIPKPILATGPSETNMVTMDSALFIQKDCQFKAGSSCLPSVPPVCLTVSEHQGGTVRKEDLHFDSTKLDKRSTRRDDAASMRKSSSVKQATKCSVTENGCSNGTTLKDPFLLIGLPPPVVRADPNKNVQTVDHSIHTECTQVNPYSHGIHNSPPAASPIPEGPVSCVVGLSQEEPSTSLVIRADMPSCPAGALVGCVTNQISTFHLTREAESAPILPSSPVPPSDHLDGQNRVSGQECVMHVDGAEEVLHDEVENDCSNDDDSDCSSPSSVSVILQSGIEEPMPLGTEGDREERPALVPSLFPLMPPTLYFSTADEKVELLPVEQRRLLKWKMTTVTPNVVKHTIARSHFRVTKKSHDWLGCWGHHMKSPGFKALGEHQKLNHFPGTFQIGRKDRLWRNLSKMQSRFGKQEFGFFPRTFVLPQDIKLLRKAWEDCGSRQKWIIKPPASARGIGIQVIHKWSQMPRKRPLLVQKYLHKPYLISGNKFDLRIYVYVTSYDPLRIYIFSDGLVRFASCKYSSSMKTLSNKFMHLTNYSVNKKNSEYQTNSDDKACQGHKWALKALWEYLGSRGVNTTLIWEKIKDIVVKTIIASEPYVLSLMKINVESPYSCHELFGFDIMLDENLKPWILEVNISPSLHSNTALDVSIKGQMVKDLLNLAGFRLPRREDVMASCSSASSSTHREKTKPELSADEKVKRAFYLTQRFAEQDFLQTVLDVLTPDDVRVLAESENELICRGQFERIFPSPSSSRYLRFFEGPRYLNILLDQWEQKHWTNRLKGIELLSTLCEKGVHLGTSDPAHMWSKCSYISRSEADMTLSVISTHPPSEITVVRCQECAEMQRARVTVSHERPSNPATDDCSDQEVASLSSQSTSPSPGSSVTSSASASPLPSLSQSL
ncbi:hypothetical protein fugu_001473 [Takifugu bimaculatus]|uniref:Tubulin tyrosine ligase-like family, member 4 n=1 Tax=Takifugu bimaculatus TaxID=433685 RepID=A0A4Z2CK98_9TELE|nr:hypothetical protein fugu_001473 [Takifugu bimaculatus]